MKRIYLISGHAQNGKDLTGQLIKKQLGDKAVILHFADYLKYICKSYLNWDGTKSEEGRTILQKVGTEMIREQMGYPTFWADRAIELIHILSFKYDYFIFGDTRFPNEISKLQAEFGDLVTTVRITRPNFNNGLSEEQLNHSSETSLDDYHFDCYLLNDKDEAELEEKVAWLLEGDLDNE